MSVTTKIIAILTLLCSVNYAAKAQQSALLWKISGKDLQHPSYLFGTMHLQCKDEFSIPPAVTSAMHESTSLCMEMDLSDPEIPKKIDSLLMLPQGDPSLHDDMDSTKFDELLRYFKDSLGIDLIKLQSAKPLLTTTIMLQRGVPCKQAISIERELMETAIRENKPLSGLELVEDQVKLFDSIPDKVEGEMLLSLLHDIQHSYKDYYEMAAAYKQQDLQKIQQLISSVPALKDYQDLLLYNRNASWIPKIKAQLAKGSVFFAVGAGHLPGDKGVITLLQKEGYTVEPVTGVSVVQGKENNTAPVQ
ncbi:TraB/GumN family protein [Chitinophaga sp. MM2321]|uniref:TraB/GumN family protein n=1 Tax=Chitinophaga sp. MM2321 TaxID=3137178 RepID=UPI0032D57D21